MDSERSPLSPAPNSDRTDYDRIVRCPDLLALQGDPESWPHADMLPFLVTHQASELWLKLTAWESNEAVNRLRAGDPEGALPALRGATQTLKLITEQLVVLEGIAPANYLIIRAHLGSGSGFDSPGWADVHQVGRQLNSVFTALLAEAGLELAELYRGHLGHPLYRVAEALVDWDQQISRWRVRHYQVIARLVGTGATGTAGTPVPVLARLLDRQHFPELWRVRADLAGGQ